MAMGRRDLPAKIDQSVQMSEYVMLLDLGRCPPEALQKFELVHDCNALLATECDDFRGVDISITAA